MEKEQKMNFHFFCQELKKQFFFKEGYEMDNQELNRIYIHFKLTLDSWEVEFSSSLTIYEQVIEFASEFFMFFTESEHNYWLKNQK